MQKDTEKLVQNTSWEKEFDRAFASPSWSPAPMKKIFDELMQDGVKPFIRKTLAQREKEIAEEVEKIDGCDEFCNINNCVLLKVLSILKH